VFHCEPGVGFPRAPTCWTVSAITGGITDRSEWPHSDRRRFLTGLRDVDADLVCFCEPDGTFSPEDLHKLLPFTLECGFVGGSRTVSNFIWDGANMGFGLQWGNWAVAKMIELLYNSSYLSDVGCTFRVLSRDCVDDIFPYCTVNGSSFGLQMLLVALLRRTKLVQVPVNYHPRVGHSSITGHLGKTVVLGLQMVKMVLTMRTRAATAQTIRPPCN